jgi:hypothetical protein
MFLISRHSTLGQEPFSASDGDRSGNGGINDPGWQAVAGGLTPPIPIGRFRAALFTWFSYKSDNLDDIRGPLHS